MSKNKVLLFIFNGFADWEPAFALPEINKSGKYLVETVGLSMQPVKSMGGLSVLPDQILGNIRPEECALLILPGGTAWEEKKMREILPVVQEFKKRNIPIAAICAATTALADAGLLDQINHSSNGKSYLKSSSADYRGDPFYKEELAVFDSNIITASGIGPIEFAREIFKILGIFKEQDLKQWFDLFKNGVMPL